MLGSACAATLLSACDPAVSASVENHCGYPVEVSMVKNGDVSVIATKTIADGEIWGNGAVATEIGVVVRIPGDTEWAVTVPWKDLKGSGGGGTPFPLKGALCPAQH